MTAPDDAPTPRRRGAPFTAGWGGSCVLCPRPIRRGDEITRLEVGGYAHDGCVPAPGADGDRCRSCQAPIRWAVTEAGKRIPVDVEPTPDGNMLLSLDDPPVAAVVRPGELQLVDDGQRFVSHFATCEFADQHRRPR